MARTGELWWNCGPDWRAARPESELQRKIMAAETSTDALVAAGVRTYVPNYAPKPVVFDHGEGSRLWDIDGREYIDLGTGISVNSFGHRHPDLIGAVTAQAGRLFHTSNLYYVEPTVRLAEELVDGTFAERVFFCNSGAEANEAAIKIVRRHASEAGRGPEEREIITFEGSFHGRTLATVTATAQPKYQEGFEPLPGGFTYCPFNDPEALEAAISDRTCAVMLEPVQGEGGVTPSRQGFLRHVQDLCRRHDALLVLDEIQSGMSRTGKFFAYEWESGIEPDVVTMAKALAGGLPMGAVLAGARAADALTVGTHGSTFGGNPVAAAAARVAVNLARSEDLLANVVRQGDAFRLFLNRVNAELNLFRDVRGKGLIIGAELGEPYEGKAGALVDACADEGVIVLVAGPSVLRLLPPLNIGDEDVNDATARMERVFRAFVAS